MYSKSCFNTIENAADFLEFSVNRGLHLAARCPASRYVFANGVNLGQVFVNQGEVLRVLFARAVGRCSFRCHGNILAIRETFATRQKSRR